MVTKNSDVIGVSREAYFYLHRRQIRERGCKPFSVEQEDKHWNKLPKNSDGLRELTDLSLGGGDGEYYGKWWSWSVNDLRDMLREGGYTWVELGTMEYITP